MEFNWFDAQHIYISPHLDDVILSCGGTIYEQSVIRRESIAVISIFAGSPPSDMAFSPFALSLHDRWQQSAPPHLDFSDPALARRSEDVRAFAQINPSIEIVHLPLLDCIYRQGKNSGEFLYASEEAIFGDVMPDDPAIEALSAIPAPPSGKVYVPMGFGHHVDHQVISQWVNLWDMSEPGRLWFYGDYPYVAEASSDDLENLAAEGFKPHMAPLSKNALQAKITAIIQHESQISTFWKSSDLMADALQKYDDLTGGELFWQ